MVNLRFIVHPPAPKGPDDKEGIELCNKWIEDCIEDIRRTRRETMAMLIMVISAGAIIMGMILLTLCIRGAQ